MATAASPWCFHNKVASFVNAFGFRFLLFVSKFVISSIAKAWQCRIAGTPVRIERRDANEGS
jgi:hypothetical protein